MPTKTYYLDESRTQVLTVKWGLSFRNFEVFYNGQSLGTVASASDLRRGHEFALPTGQALATQLRRNQGLEELELRLDGRPVPGSATHPGERLRQAWYTLLGVGCLNFVVGLIAVFGQITLLLHLGLGWGSVVEGVLYIALGWWGYSRIAPVPFGIACALLLLDGAMMLVAAAENGGSGFGGIFLRFVLIVLVYRGLVAARQLRAEAVGVATT
jgi:hypothetical protein